MLRVSHLLLVFVLILAQSFQIRELDLTDFEIEVIKSDNLWLVATSDVQQSIIKQLSNAALATKGVFNIGHAVDKSLTGNQIRFYGEPKQEPINYEGEITIENIIDFLFEQTQKVLDERGRQAKEAKQRQHLIALQAQRAKEEADEEAKIREKSDTILIATIQKYNQLFQSREPFLLNVYTSNCSDCKALNKQWEKVTEQLRDRIKVAKVNITEVQALEETLKVTEFPAIVYFPAGIKNIDKRVIFEGSRRSRQINKWALQQYQRPVEASIDHLTSDSYRSICKNAKGTCVIFFVESEDSPALQQLSNLPKSYTGKPISFFYLIKGQQQKLAQQFEVTSYPNTLMIYTTRKTKWVLDYFVPEKIQDAVGQVMLGNRNNFKRYNFEEILE